MNDLARLEKKEGYPRAYETIDIAVSCNRQRLRAFAFTTRIKSAIEIAPGADYLQKIINGAQLVPLPGAYLTFLHSLRGKDENALRSGYLVRSTVNRTGAKGASIVRVSRNVARSNGLKRHCAIAYGDRAVTAKVISAADVPDDGCELDQNVRLVLGIRGQRSYGQRVSIHPSRGGSLPYRLIHPRSLNLQIHQPAWLDSEKNICVMHQGNIALLGLAEGQYARLVACIRGADAKYALHEVVIRIFTGTPRSAGSSAGPETYPRPGEIYVDKDTRIKLGLPDKYLGYPITVYPAVQRLFADRLIFYGITLFLGTEAILRLAEAFAGFVNVSERVQTVGSITVAVVITVGLAVVDLRARLRY